MRAVIFCGGEIVNYDRVGERIKAEDMILCADSGYMHARKLGLSPYAVLGDFDSFDVKAVDCENVMIYPAKKDYTDSEIALRYAFGCGCDDILLLGAAGGRLDHTLGNICLLKLVLERGASGEMYDGAVSVRLAARGSVSLTGKPGDIFSIIPFAEADGLTTKGLEYPLINQSLAGASTGLSNVFEEECVSLEISSGMAIVIHIQN